MEQIKLENLSFGYPDTTCNALEDISLTVNSGDFILICGKSGSGKTTLLRQIKKELAPHGKRTGEIFFNGQPLDRLSLRESAEKIGFVGQEPENQLVTDKVWHELAFGLENLGLKSDEIRLRTAEISSYFGIDEWFNKKTAELSGGQKQILNLAAVMIMRPQVLLLDEPTSQLDAIAAESFLDTLYKLNRDFGTTVIITEQRLEEVFPLADRIVVTDNGRIVSDLSPQKTGEHLRSLPDFLALSVPTPMRIYSKGYSDLPCPVTVREGRRYLESTNHADKFVPEKTPVKLSAAVELKEIYFGYDTEESDVLKNLTLKIPENSVTAVTGSNGAGKTTLLRIIAGTLSPYSGRVKLFGESRKKSKKRIAVLPQDVRAVFTESSVYLDLREMTDDEEKIKTVAALTKITDKLASHPFDLSGGERQRGAFAKVLLANPDILLLDEPTKGMDGEFKKDFAEILSALTSNGCTVVMISHDIEFAAKHADYCAMLFDGEVAAFGATKEFFAKNRYFTTAACKLSSGIIDGAVTDEDIIKCLKEKSFQS